MDSGVEVDVETGETFEKEQEEIEKIVGSSSITKKNAHKRGTFSIRCGTFRA